MAQPVTGDSGEVIVEGPPGEGVEVVIVDITYPGTIGEDGTAVITIPIQTPGTEIEIVLIGEDGSRSEPVVIIVAPAPVAEEPTITTTMPITGMNINDRVPLNVTITPEGSDQSVTWFSHNTSAEVDEFGMVTGLEEGTAIIEAESVQYPGLIYQWAIEVFRP